MPDPKLTAYARLVLQKNQEFNLTGAKSEDELMIRHIEDSLKALNVPEFPLDGAVLDVGTGAGMPGIPLAIARPEIRVTMLDATQKKVRAVSDFIETLELSNASAVAARAEEIAHHPQYRQAFDAVVTRAVAKLPILLEYCIPFCRNGGHVIAFKGPSPDEEVTAAQGALRKLRAEVCRIETYAIREQHFNLVVIKVMGTTPRRYPRPHGQMRRKPLGL